MNLRDTILEEHSKSQTAKIVKYIGPNEKRFAELMKLFFSGEYRVTQRAAWPMSYCVREHPSLIQPYFKKLLQMLARPDNHDAVTRNILRLLQDVKIPKRFHGDLMNRCFEYITASDIPSAIKAFALTILENLSNEYPDIRKELQIIIEERFVHESPAFQSRARKILKKISGK